MADRRVSGVVYQKFNHEGMTLIRLAAAAGSGGKIAVREGEEGGED